MFHYIAWLEEFANSKFHWVCFFSNLPICTMELLFVLFLALIKWSTKIHRTHITAMEDGWHSHLPQREVSKSPTIVFKPLLQIAAWMPSSPNYRSWLRVGSTSKGHDSTSLDLKAIAKCGHPRPMARWRKSFIPLTMWSMGFGFAMITWSIFVSGNKNEYVMDPVIVPNT